MRRTTRRELLSAEEWVGASPLVWRRAYPGRKEQVSVARRFAESLFAAGHCAEAVGFAVSELATNALRYTRSGDDAGWFGVEIVDDDPVYVAVTDLGGDKVPVLWPESIGDQYREHGRGLRALSTMAIALGVHGSPALGHTVWVDLDPLADLNDDLTSQKEILLVV
ncbi:ATP-binding protein [Actinomadura hibisca]|uniref:ATP-binding protein n=1 Tax=Actinomadura hibisca TaxID=68565 RepID=UPI00083078FA|nr:ATP-binding protein [Actinomadura hibisca]